jgi:hypothetical protein
LPDYEQPPPPDDGYLWTPGYWAWGPGGYYWIPGTWVSPPRVGVLWTPGYWAFGGGVYLFHAGYWGPHVGFYGGVNYGFGYGGVGFAGGRWEGNSFAYNRSVTNVTNVTVIHNTYNETVVNNVTVNRVSYNGGPAGIAAQPTPQERIAASEPHIPPTQVQRQHVQEALRTPALAAKANGGHPAIAATPRPAAFNAPGVVGARGAAPVARATGAAGEPAVRAQVPGQQRAPEAYAARPGGPQPNAARPGAPQPNATRPYAAQPNAGQPHAVPNRGEPGAPARAPAPAPKAAKPNGAQPKPEEHKREGGDHGAGR